ncbi:ATPase [Clostridium nigeriense]|uniref:ATPase n=1 Tax=Clostridium nigeriense TaxID=1805470 RepID=UPI00083747C4|nr:ATPase [Clostridium nigeriense]
MALEAINDIKKAEDQAEKLVQEATIRSKEIIKNASIQAEEEYNKILECANLRKIEILKKSEEDGNLEAAPILEKGEEEVQEIKNVSDDKQNNAINLIVERIVKIHGNS